MLPCLADVIPESIGFDVVAKRRKGIEMTQIAFKPVNTHLIDMLLTREIVSRCSDTPTQLPARQEIIADDDTRYHAPAGRSHKPAFLNVKL